MGNNLINFNHRLLDRKGEGLVSIGSIVDMISKNQGNFKDLRGMIMSRKNEDLIDFKEFVSMVTGIQLWD